MNKTFEKVIETYHSRCRKATKKKLYNKLMGAKSRWAKQNDCSHEDIELLISTSLGYCPYCLGELDVKNMSLDHITPLDRGGDTKLNNLMLVCRTCNTRKGTLKEKEYRDLLKFIIPYEEPARKYILRKLASRDMWSR